MKTQTQKATEISTNIADNITQNITPADVRNILNDLNDSDAEENITAHSGGGQTDATQLTTMYNSIDVCARDGDSVKLVQANAGFRQKVFNNTGNLLSVFPTEGDEINGYPDDEIIIFPGNAFFFECLKDNKWVYTNTILTPASS